jgi:hypothetical protein
MVSTIIHDGPRVPDVRLRGRAVSFSTLRGVAEVERSEVPVLRQGRDFGCHCWLVQQCKELRCIKPAIFALTKH